MILRLFDDIGRVVLDGLIALIVIGYAIVLCAWAVDLVRRHWPRRHKWTPRVVHSLSYKKEMDQVS